MALIITLYVQKNLIDTLKNLRLYNKVLLDFTLIFKKKKREKSVFNHNHY